ncbi:MAG: Crp/Fnr family transcriptional regulator [Bacteroidetes bacterium]|nr:Crp/Fnr family transcriptional regulator [Bacteroidota bacterium]
MKQKFEIPHCETCQARLQSIFSEVSSQDLEKLSLHKGCNFHRAGQILFQEGGHPAGLFCINRGRIKLYKTGEGGREQIIRLAKDGDVVGYRAMISGQAYSASAAVLEDATICFIPKSSFLDLLKESSTFNARVMELLCHDLATAEQKELSFAQKPVKQRLAETLLLLKEFYGTEEDGMTLKGSLSRQEIANIVGTATETVIRLLSELNTKKTVALDHKKIKILNPQALLRTARVYD